MDMKTNDKFLLDMNEMKGEPIMVAKPDKDGMANAYGDEP